MSKWRKTATIWVNDPKRGRVLVGPFGFAWWSPRKVYVCAFRRGHQEKPMTAYRNFNNYESAKSYWLSKVPNSAVHRFVKTGLPPG